MANFNEKVWDLVSAIKQDEIEAVDFSRELDGSNDMFAIRPTIALTISGEPHVKYGVFNRTTNLLEAEAQQMVTAQSWAEALKRGPNYASDLPGFEKDTGITMQ